ncbi:MAG: hypothetical protein ABS81_21435 [Pseudonocardia sp. SCN 72-86]|nr:MAG: hypothetical protein ABS81_21435 [Pseudonocardia sp. SCN 72-86]
MPTVDVMDETFLVVTRSRLAAVFAGDQGMRWTVTGALVGSMEVWLEEVLDGTVLHYYLRADAAGPDGAPVSLPPRRAAAEARRRHHAAKALALALKRTLEQGRAAGEPPAARGGRAR